MPKPEAEARSRNQKPKPEVHLEAIRKEYHQAAAKEGKTEEWRQQGQGRQGEEGKGR